MDYFGILKKAYQIALKHRYLWIFGILAGGIGAGWSSFNFSGDSDLMNKYINSSTFNGVSPEKFWSTYWNLIIIVGGLILLVGLVFFILSIISRGAILGSVEAIEKGEKNNFRLGFAFGWRKFWRTLGVGLSIFLIILLLLIILILPIVLFVLAKIYTLAIIYGIIIFLFCLLPWLFIGVMSPYIQRMVVLGNRPVWETIFSSWQFFHKHWQNILVMYLLLMVAGFVAGMGILLVLLVVGGLLFGIGFALFLASQAIFWMYVAVFGFAFLIFMLILGGIINSFYSVVLTLTYLELVKGT